MLALVTSIVPYDFEDSKTKRPVRGVSIQFYDPTAQEDGNTIGQKPIKLSGPLELSNSLKTPGLYDLDVSPVMKGKTATWKLNSAVCKKTLSIKQICEMAIS